MASEKPAASAAPGGPSTLPPKNRLVDLVGLRYLSQAICLANQKGIANIVTRDKLVHVSEVAEKLGCHETNLYRLMSFLAAYGVFEEKEGHFFIGNEMSNVMREDVPDSCHFIIRAYGCNEWWQSTVNMELTLDKNSEKTPFERVNGLPFYEYLAQNPSVQRNFDLGVKSQTQAWQANVPNFYDFSRYRTVVDMAGGCGVLLKAVLQKCPDVQGTLFENPAVTKNVLPELFDDDQFRHRFNFSCGNFLESVDVTADLYMVAMTLHCFEDTRLAIILKNIATAMRRRPGSRLLIIEMDYEKSFPLNAPGGRQLDINMMVVMGGRERDFNTWQSLLKLQGIKVLQKIQFPPSFAGFECELA